MTTKCIPIINKRLYKIMAPALQVRETKRRIQKEYLYLELVIIIYALVLIGAASFFIILVLFIHFVGNVFKKLGHILILESSDIFLEMSIYTWEVLGDPLTELSRVAVLSFNSFDTRCP
ncbi:hypothetical protein LIER_43894 [Lithospermum erythrorhizon]|uniref:Uncharacterized protein n=1 Tax=Lithospermum erythrorhizon TaxID=34254 RepID=A0AAV3R646_LITER